MADPHEFDDVMPENTSRPQPPKPIEENIFVRLIHMILIGLMLNIAGTLVGIIAIVQFIIMLFSSKQPNQRLADAGTDIGIWMAKAARYQAGASEVKPWPWTDLD